MRTLALIALPVLLWLALVGATDEVQETFDQNPPAITQLAQLDEQLDPRASVRLDVDPTAQLWVAYFLSGQPLCSQHPLLETSYPHVPISARPTTSSPSGACSGPSTPPARPSGRGSATSSTGRTRASPGHDFCSRRMQQTVTEVL